MTSGPPDVVEVDPFDLPDWLGTAEVTWTPPGSVHAGHLVPGELTGSGRPRSEATACDLLAVDQAYPAPVLTEAWRTRSHREWTHGQVLLLRVEGRLTLAVPGTSFTADRAVEALSRLARAVGVAPQRFAVVLRF